MFDNDQDISAMQQEASKLRCVVHASVPELWPTRVRLSVRLPRPCFPCFYKKHVVARLNFQLDNWKFIETGEWVNETILNVDHNMLMGLNGEHNIRLKCCTPQRHREIRLGTTVADLMEEMESSTDPITLEFSSTKKGIEFTWPLPERPDYTENKISGEPNSSAVTENENTKQNKTSDIYTKWDTYALASSEKYEVLSQEPPPVTEDEGIFPVGQESAYTENFARCGQTSTGRHILRPVNEKTDDTLRSPDSWKSEDNLLDVRTGHIRARNNRARNATSNVTEMETVIEIRRRTMSKTYSDIHRPSFPGSKIYRCFSLRQQMVAKCGIEHGNRRFNERKSLRIRTRNRWSPVFMMLVVVLAVVMLIGTQV